MALIKWDPGRELDALQGDATRLFDAFFQDRSPFGTRIRTRAGTRTGVGTGPRTRTGTVTRRWLPAMDLSETEAEYVLRADLPGVAEDDVELEVKEDVLTISGERAAESEEGGNGFHRVERTFGRFSRSLGLPTGVDAEAVRASFERGVLEVRIPKPAEARATRIPIGAGGDGS